jgi:hypothetical protein
MAVSAECKVCIFGFSHVVRAVRQSFGVGHCTFPDPSNGAAHEGISEEFGGACHVEKVYWIEKRKYL